jgi:membrane protein DedA with SNARE-associated domain
MITNLTKTAILFGSTVWFVGMVVTTVGGGLMSIVQTENKNRWLKVLFIVCGVLLWVWIATNSFLFVVDVVTTPIKFVNGDVDTQLLKHLITDVISCAITISIAGMLALFMIVVYEKLGEKRPYTTLTICVMAGLFAVVMRSGMVP